MRKSNRAKIAEKKLILPIEPTLADFQLYVRKMVKLRGFIDAVPENVPKKFIIFLEECGEFAKAARKATGLHLSTTSKLHDLGHEAADVFMFILDICNCFGIDLEKAFREKEELNKKRKWIKAKRSRK